MAKRLVIDEGKAYKHMKTTNMKMCQPGDSIYNLMELCSEYYLLGHDTKYDYNKEEDRYEPKTTGPVTHIYCTMYCK